MDEERETGMGCMTLMMLAIVIALLAMCSCEGRKTIAENIVVHDTIVVTHSDTVSIDRWLTHHDTIRIENERVVTLVRDTIGKIDTIRVENNTTHWQHTTDKGLETRLVSKVDSILKVMDAKHNKETERIKERTPWWGWLLIGGGLTMGCVGILASRK